MSRILGLYNVWSSGNPISSGFSTGNNISQYTLSYFQCIFFCMSAFLQFLISLFQLIFSVLQMLFPSESLIQYSSASRYLLIISHNTEVSKSFPVIENYLHHDFHNFHQISLHHPSIHDFAPSVQSMNCPFFLTGYQPGTAKWLNPEPIQFANQYHIISLQMVVITSVICMHFSLYYSLDFYNSGRRVKFSRLNGVKRYLGNTISGGIGFNTSFPAVNI